MMSMSTGSLGLLILVCRGLLHTAQLALGREVKAWEWPYFRLMAAACMLSAAIIAGGLAAAQTQAPLVAHRKWVVLRGIFGAGSFVCSVMAAQLGTPLGDVEALRCLNMVAAAVLGRIFLDEPLGRPHLAALSCSVVGALLIAQPSGLFGASGAAADAGAETSLAWLGYILAPASGVCQACVFVTSRKAPGTSLWFQALSSHAMSSLVAGLLPTTPAVEDFSVWSLSGAPWQAAGLFGFLFASTFMSTVMLSAASQWCTAAESAIVSTSSGMGFGYAAQTQLYGASPDRLALSGAGLMLLGVTVMAVAQVQPPKPGAAEAAQHLPLTVQELEAVEHLPPTLLESNSSRAQQRMPLVAGDEKAKLLPLVKEDFVLDVSDVRVGLHSLVAEDKLADLATRPAASDASTADDMCSLQDDDYDEEALPLAEELA